MKMKRLTVIAIATVLCIVLALPMLVRADVVWSEDFSSNPEERWTEIGEANYDGSNCRGTDGTASDIVYRPSEVSVGSWSFDVQYVGEFIRDPRRAQTSLSVRFMCSNPEVVPCNRSYFEIKLGETSTGPCFYFEFGYELGDWESGELAEYSTSELTNTHRVQNIKITRDSAGHLNALLNGTVIMQTTDTSITTSEHFAMIFGGDFAVDNIVVDDTPPPGVPLELLAVGIGGATVIVIVVVVILKRR
ncbi:MAG: hypothetical protein ACXABV_13840 [Candidatus Thorarchaeota archaeon]